MEAFLTNRIYYVAILKFLYRNKRKDSRLYQTKTYVYIIINQIINHNNNQIILFMSINKLTMIME